MTDKILPKIMSMSCECDIGNISFSPEPFRESILILFHLADIEPSCKVGFNSWGLEVLLI